MGTLDLMPVIRDTAMFGWGALSSRLSGNTRAENLPCLRPFAETLSLALVLDWEIATSTTFLTTLPMTH